MALCNVNNPCPPNEGACGIKYTGMRYVPLFADPAQWDNSKTYEPLTIVLNEGNSYTSKTFVPIGVDINNEQYWALTGNYNAQLEAYRQAVEELKKQFDLGFKDVITLQPTGLDDTEYIRTAILNSLPGQTLRFTNGNYIISGNNGFSIDKNINLSFDSNAVLDCTACTADTIINFTGNTGTFYPLQSSITKGSTVITLPPQLASILKKGDLVHITTAKEYGGNGELFCQARDYYYRGETVQVDSLQGNNITICGSIYDNYNLEGTVVGLINPIKTNVNGINIKALSANNQKGINVLWGFECIINTPTIAGCSYSCISFTNCINSTISKANLRDFLGTSGTSYGVALYSCQDCYAYENYINGGRHAISHGGTFPCRNIRVFNNTLTNSSTTEYTLDVHENNELIYIYNNTVTNMSVFGGNISVYNNHIDSNSYEALFIQPSINSDYFVIKDNIINSEGNGIRFDFSSFPNLIVDKLKICNNVVTSKEYGIFITQTNNANCNINEVISTNNNVNSVSESFIISNILINTLKNTNDNLLSETSNCWRNIYKIVDKVMINGCCFETKSSEASKTPFKCYNEQNTCVITIINSTFIGAETFNNYGEAITSNSILIKDNVFINLLRGGFGVFGCSELLFKDNLLVNTDASNPILPVAEKSIVFNTIGDVSITYGNTAPTTQTWKKGDRCYNNSPATGNPKSWVCTVGGTPGTWVSEGNL